LANAARSTGGKPRNEEQALRLDEVRQFGRVALVEGRDRQGDVAESLGKDASQTEGHHRTESRVPLHPDHELPVAGDHLLDKHGFQSARRPLFEQPVGRRDRFRVGCVQSKHDQAGLGLVVDLGGDALHDHLAADPAGRFDRFGFAGHQSPVRDRDAVCGEEPLRVPFVQRRSAGRQGGLDHVSSHGTSHLVLPYV
jgi:hypothetical protein